MDWQTTYPTTATVNDAGLMTLETWKEKLPRPETDLQRSVMRRIEARAHQLASQELRAKHPDIADKMNEAMDMVARLTGRDPWKRY